MSRILTMLKTPSSMAGEVTRLEERLGNLDPAHAPLWIQKAKELAEFMITHRVPSSNLLRNAESIAELLGELGPKDSVNVTPGLIKSIDQLVTLYAYDLLPQSTKDTVTSLVDTEEKGVDFTLSYLIGQRTDERSKIVDMAQFNYFKGHVPSENRPGMSLIVADDLEEGQLKLLGFKRIGDYKGSAAERGAPRRGYYFAPLSGRAMYNQGILQNVRPTAYGVDPNTGFSNGRMSAGTITDPYTVETIRKARRLNTNTDEALMPVYDFSGKVVAWERSVNPQEELRLQRKTHLAEVIGIWRGRQVEEENARKFNIMLVDRLAERWNQERATRSDEYINVFSRAARRKDKVLNDAVRLITPETRAYIENQFDDGEFWVRKDMLNDSLGYRSASVGDAWTGVTRVHPEIMKNVRRLTTGVFGVEAYKYMVTGEKFWQNFVADARTTIVVKSVVVAASNMISNIYHLAARGVPVASILSGIPKKTAELNFYVRGQLRKIEADAELRVAVAENDIVRERKARAEIQAIEDSWKRLSIWPLLEAGELSSISDAGISQDEILLAEGKLNDYMERLTSKLPDGIRTAGRYAIIAKDTALFQGLQKAVTYGDFLGKAILYDDLVIRQKKPAEYALGRISEEFVNYDRLAGRGRSYLENMGVLWFWHFKVRAAKIAMSTVRNNPLHALLAGLAPQPEVVGSIGSPMTDNIFSVTADGRLEWSVGPGQGLRAYSLNPWMNLFN
jgi:hypothetical protein